MTLTRTQKVKQRTQQLIKEFIIKHGREPTISELKEEYLELLKRLRKAPRGPAKHPQGFATMSPERLKELSRKGGLVKKENK